MSNEVNRVRISVLATHPIQYQVPWFRALAAHPQVDLHVLFEYLPDDAAQGEGFGVPFQWDVPLLEGYRYSVLNGEGPRCRRRALFALARHFASAQPQVSLLTGWHSAVLLAAPTLAHHYGSRCMVRGDSNDIKQRSIWMRRAHRLLLSRYERFLVVGSANRRFYEANGVATETMVLCPHFVDTGRFAAAASSEYQSQSRSRIRYEFGIKEHETCFLFAGKLEAKKRPLDLVSAIHALRDLPAHVLVVGSGELESELRNHARGLPVSFAGFVNQSAIPDYYQAADCLVLPSDSGETWGLVVNEAMASGRAAIVSDQAGCAMDLVKDGETGWRYRMGDVDALVRVMREALADSDRLEQMGMFAQKHVSKNFSLAGARDATVRAALELVSDGAPR